VVILYQRIGPHHKIGAETHAFIDGRTGERKCAHSVYSPAAELNTFRVPAASLCLRAVIQRSSILDIHGSGIVGELPERDVLRERIDTLSHSYMPRIRGEIFAYGQFSATFLHQIGDGIFLQKRNAFRRQRPGTVAFNIDIKRLQRFVTAVIRRRRRRRGHCRGQHDVCRQKPP